MADPSHEHGNSKSTAQPSYWILQEPNESCACECSVVSLSVQMERIK